MISLITCLVIAQLYFAADMRDYAVRTEYYPRIMAIVAAEDVPVDEEDFVTLFGELVPFRESSLGVESQLVGDDGTSFGAYQNKITVELLRDYPLGWDEMDSLAMVLELETDPYSSQRRYQQTFYEHLWHWREYYGKTGMRLWYLAIRSTNRGLDYDKAMDSLGTAYVKAMVPGYPNYGGVKK